MRTRARPAAWLAGWLLAAGGLLSAQDWPTYQHDPARSAATTALTPSDPRLLWTFTPLAPPRKAWGDPSPNTIEGFLELPRLRFDDAFHVAAAGGVVVFGSSSEYAVIALDAASGAVRWRFLTEGPVRLAPTLSGGAVFAGCDDGRVYCLDAADGSLRWQFRPGPGDERVLGNGHLISLWPVRTGVLVQDGVAYVGAGVFPAEGVFLYALEAATGNVIWKNDTFGAGGGADYSPQGYMLLSGNYLVVPSGRRPPMVFDRRDGRFLHATAANRWAVGPCGGTFAVVDGDTLYNGTEQMLGYRLNDGVVSLIDDVRRLAFSPEHACLLTGSELVVCPRKTWDEAGRQRLPLHRSILQTAPALAELEAQERRLRAANQPVPETLANQIASSRTAVQEARAARDRLAQQERRPPAWTTAWAAADSLIVTADGVLVGGEGRVEAFALADGRPLWRLDVPGRARGLALSEGRLLVSSDTGTIVCFAPGVAEVRPVGRTEPVPPEPGPGLAGLLAALGPDTPARGYALVFGPGALPVAAELARRPGLQTYVVAEPGAAGPLRAELDRLGLHGHRAAVLAADNSGRLPFAPYLANVVVWAAPEPPPQTVCAELFRVLKPWGGRLVVPQEAVPRFPGDAEGLRMVRPGPWAVLERGPLPGAGAWTHQYAEPGNTACSDDALVQGDLGVLWYGEPGPARIPNRHISSAAPLAADGRLFVQGVEVLMAYDSSNGVELWTRDIPGAARSGLKTGCSNFACAEGDLFVVAGGLCHRLRGATGETVRTYALPPDEQGNPRPWGAFLAVTEGVLLGSAGNRHLFALSLETGAPLWTCEGESVDWITVACHAGRVFGVDRRVTDAQREQVLAALPPTQRVDRLGKPVTPDVRTVFCLDLRTGSRLWESPQYVSDCIRVGSAGGELVLMAAQGVVVLCGQPWNGHFWQEFYAGEFSRRSLIVLDAATGKTLWSGRKGYRSRPLIVGDTIVAEPWACELRTGAPRQRIHPLTDTTSDWQFSRPGHHCGNISACANGLFFRSGCAAYYDLRGDYGTVHFGGQRPGCWINCIPANGVVLMPEASSGCFCNYSLHCTTVFAPRREPRSWGVYSAAGSGLPVRRLALNLGAPGDRRDAEGLLWLAWPRPGEGRMILPLKLSADYAAGGGAARGLPPPPGDDHALDWIDTSGAQGLTRLRIPLLGEADGEGLYLLRVRLRSTGAAAAGTCVLGLSLQGRKAADGIDLAAAPGGPGRVVVQEFAGIPARDSLELALTASGPGAAATPPPWTVTGLEVLCEAIPKVGMAVAGFWLNDAAPQGNLVVTSANRTGSPFRGTLAVTLAAPLAAEPAEQPVEIQAEETVTLTVPVRLTARGTPATVPARVALLRADGTLEVERTVTIEYLAGRGRVTVTPDADAYVEKKTPVRNYGAQATLAVDGGATEMEDPDHKIALLRFPVRVPGRPVSARLRLYVPEGGHNHSADSGTIRLVEGAWEEGRVTYASMPAIGTQVADLGKVDQGTWAERTLDADLAGRETLDLAVVPRGTDGAIYESREGRNKPELVIEYEIPAPQP